MGVQLKRGLGRGDLDPAHISTSFIKKKKNEIPKVSQLEMS